MKLLSRVTPALLGFLVAITSPVFADNPPKKQVYVRPEDMPAAEAARKKAAAGRQLLKERKIREGLQMIDEAVGELERTTGPDSDFSASNRNILVAMYKELGEPEKLKAVESRADAARKKWSAPTSRPANENTGKAMVKMTSALEALKSSDFARASTLLEEAMPDVEKSDASKKMYLMIAGVLASLYDHSQQFAKGEALRKDVIGKMEQSLGDTSEVADQYESFATHYMMRADPPKALIAQRRCVEISRKTSGPSAALVDRLITLSNLQTGTGDLRTGEATLVEAMQMVKTLKPVDPVRMVRVAHALATVFDGQFRNAEGDQVAEMACNIAKVAGSPEVVEEAEPECIRTALAKKDTKAAGILAAQRFARFEKQYGKSPGLYASAAHSLAQVRWAEGKKDEATTIARKAAEAQEKALARLLEVSGDAQKRAHLSLVTSQVYDLISMGGSGEGGPAQTRLALETVLRRKGRSLDASADAAHVVRLFEKPEEKALAQRQVELRREIAALGLRGAGGLPGVDPVALAAKLEAEHDEIGNKLAAASPVFRSQAKPVTIEAVQAAIPEDSALVEYVYYHSRDTSSPVFATKEARFVAYVLHKTGDPVAVDLGDSIPLGRAVSKLRRSLSDHGDVLPDAKEVYNLVVAPIAKHLRSSDARLIISPDDDLNLVPFAALIDDRGRFLVQDRELTYVTSGRDLLRIAAGSTPSRTKAVVVGNPAFDTAAGPSASQAAGTRAGDLDNARFPALPGTDVETKAISEFLGAPRFTQADATKSRLTGVQGPVVLHVATHGFFLKRERDAGTAGTRSLEYDPGSPTPAPAPRTANPLVRSGLALAGANQKTSADGLLTALEASSMNLDGTKLVILSACETGVGETEVGEGVYGLRRSLVVAGSESQLMSLWKVDDEATRDLMIAFYRDLKAGAGRSAALRKVQLAMLAKKETAHPYFWAAFIPSGAWTPMSFDVKPEAPPSPPAKDRARSSSSESDATPRHVVGAMGLLGFHYMTMTNLRDQPDRAGGLLGLHMEHALLSGLVDKGGNGFGVHDAALLSLLAGFRTSDGATYSSGTDEGSFAAGFRAGYELALGVRSSSVQGFVGAQAMYSTFVLGDARSYGSTLPLVALVGFHATGSTWIDLRGQYGKWIVDQETASAAISFDIDGLVLRGGVEELKMPASVSLDGDEARAGARRQISTIGTFAIGGSF